MSAGAGDSITILHVDDDPDFTDLTAEFLEREDDRFEVLTETDSQAVLDRLDSTAVDCLVSDYQMPGMDGIELLEEVRADHPKLPFILFTGEGSEAVAGEAISAGVTDYIQKSSGTGQYELLANRIREAVAHFRARLSHEEIFEKSGVGLTIFDVDNFELVAANQQYFDLLGCEAEDCLQLSPVELTAEKNGYSPERAREHLETAIESGSYTFEWPIVTRDEKQIWIEVTAERARIGGQDRLLGTVRDVTDRKEQERRLSTLISNLPGIMYRCDNRRGWPMEIVRGDAEDLVGYRPEEIESGAISWGADIVHPDDRDAVWEGVQEGVKNGEPFTVTYRIQTADGEERWVWEQGRPVGSSNDDVEILEGFITDVTDRMDHRRKLQRYKLAIDSSFDLMAAIDTDQNFLFGNDAYCQYHSCGAGDLAGKSIESVIGPETYEAAKPKIESVLQGEPLRYEMTREHPEEGERHLDIRYAPIEDEGTVQGAIATMRDVTDRKEHEQALASLHEAATDLEAAEDEEEVYDTLVEAAQGILEFDLVAVDVEEDGALVQRAWSLDVETQGYFERTSLEEDDTFATRAYNGDTVIVVDDLREYEITPADSEYRSVLTVPISGIGTFQAVSKEIAAFDEGDRELAELLVGHAREALQRIDHERSLRSQRERLRRENERLEEFASIVSHDLRNPLTVAAGELEAARVDTENPHLDEIEQSLDRMETIIEDVLTMARNGSIVDDTDRKTFDLATMLEECWRTVETADATLDVETEATVTADADRVRRALENLIRNAVEHAGQDVTITVGDLDGNGFYVEDDGPGIPPEDREAVFDPGHTTQDGGTGFGLAIVKEIVNAHGWSIAVGESDQGGTRFEITGLDD